MSEERRKDIGTKLGFFILTALVSMMLTLLFTATYKKADEALALGNKNEKDVAVLQEMLKNVKDNYVTINYKLDKLLGWDK